MERVTTAIHTCLHVPVPTS